MILTIAQVSCTSFKPAKAIATWIPSENLPEKIGYLEDTDQPLVDIDGVLHEITQCNVTQDSIYVRAKFSNPYEQTVSGVVALTVDSPEAGEVWGFYEVQIPSKRSTIEFDSNLLNEEDVEVIMEIAETNAEDLVECSMHLIGFLDKEQYHVHEPVTYITVR